MATAPPTLRNFIDGESPPAERHGETMAVLNPATGEECWRAPVSSAARRRRRRARRAARVRGLVAATPAERAQALLALADAIEEHGEELARLEALNAGKPIEAVSRDELPVMADNLRFFAGAARCLEGRAAGEYMQGYTSFMRREAIGVIGQITPWNYPLMMAIWKIAPALAAGNTVVLKPAETTPVTTVRFAELAADILPPGVLNVVMGPGEPTGQALLEHPDVDMVSLTGSVATGKHVARTAAETLKRVHLELGGKAPVIVFDDVDLDTAIETIAGTGYYNAGQDCTAATRVLAGPERLRRCRRRPGRAGSRPCDRRHACARHHARPGQLRAPARARARASSSAAPPTPSSSPAARSPTREGFYLEPTVVAGLEQDDEMVQRRDLRPGDHRAALHRRGAGDRVGQRHALRPRLLGVDARRRAARCASPRRCGSAASGSTTTSRSSRRCRTAASRSPATARTSACTRSRTTRSSST